MKTFSKQLLTLIFVLLLFSFSACDDEDFGYWRNNKINEGKRRDFHALNDQVIKYLKNNDSKSLEALLSRDLLEESYTIRLEELLSNRLKTSDYYLMDEYFAVNKYKATDTIINKNDGVNSYALYYTGITGQMYFAIYVPKTGHDKWMITITYAKYDYGWKISEFDMAPYKINDKTAPELYNLAFKKLGKNYLMDAKNTLDLAVTCLTPSKLWHYLDEKEISSEDENITNLTNRQYHLPGVINGIKTKPVVISIFQKSIPEGTFPTIYYISKIKLSDTSAIKRENEEVKKAIGKIIPGIDKEKQYLFYAVFNQYPSAKKTVDRFEITDKLH